ncbi:hypothetical protein G6F56_011271 [Rhizopus delemar]|nr:hypothetical protein G6F56_011271 [Rhizopus delemar]
MHLSLSQVITSAVLLIPLVSAASTTVHVCPTCTYSTITTALNALPNNTETWTVSIAPGNYTEQLIVSRSNTILKPSSSKGLVSIQYAGSHDTQIHVGSDSDSAVLAVRGERVKVYDMDIVNTFHQTYNMANLALSVEAAKVSFYNVKFYGFQDTLFVGTNASAYFKNCHVEGSVDFIFGSGDGYFESSDIASNKGGGYITAHKRKDLSAPGGFYFNKCKTFATLPSGPLADTKNTSMTFTSPSQFPNSCYLGRPWNEYSRVVYLNTVIGSHITPAAWSSWKATDPRTGHVSYYEYNDSGANPWNATVRANFSSLLTKSEAAQYTPKKIFGDISWIDSKA